FMVNLGTIEINPWNSTIQKPDHPDYAAIDLDPGDKTTFSQLVETCLACKEILDSADIPAYCKTSGSRGLHIFIPLGGKYDYDQARDFVHRLMLLVHQRLPKITSLERSPNERRSQIYLDWLQNKQGQTLVAAYSARPRENATVSTPLHWREVNEQLKITDFTIETMPERLKKEGDLWKPVLGKEVALEKVLEKLMR
ncbi:MAG: DNA ligase, partial [Bacteroidota bacterium]